MKGRAPLRFLALVVGGWIAARVAWLMPASIAEMSPVLALALPELESTTPVPAARANPHSRPSSSGPTPTRSPRPARATADPSPPPSARDLSTRPEETRARMTDDDRDGAVIAVAEVSNATPPIPVAPTGSHRVSGYAYLFARPGSGGAALGPGGQLGASQAGVRVAYAVMRRIAVAARVSAPLRPVSASEAAVGVDLLAAPGTTWRLSIERRIALGHGGRNAWSAYAAGGFYEGLGHGVEVDGYAQAGVVGLARRDLFADSALRVGGRLPLDAERALVVGAGAWGAAQPGTARLDIGPRVALALPVGRVAATLAIEGRLRIAGRARPGSGVALTLAADF